LEKLGEKSPETKRLTVRFSNFFQSMISLFVLLLLPCLSIAVTPVFVLSYVRLKVLQESIRSYQKCLTDVEIVICDHGSEYDSLLGFLNDVEQQQDVTVYRYSNKLQHWKDLDPAINYSVRRWYEENQWRKDISDVFAVSDPDVALVCEEDNKDLDHIDFYKRILDRYPEVDVVGPNLRIDDIPEYYPMRAHVISRNDHFWRSELQFDFEGVALTKYTIDTTFGVYRKGHEVTKPRVGVRVDRPYDARHLDWYINPEFMTEDQIVYAEVSQRRITNYGGMVMLEEAEIARCELCEIVSYLKTMDDARIYRCEMDSLSLGTFSLPCHSLFLHTHTHTYKHVQSKIGQTVHSIQDAENRRKCQRNACLHMVISINTKGHAWPLNHNLYPRVDNLLSTK